jgi:hypothetical protein
MANLALTELLASYVPKLIQNRVIAIPPLLNRQLQRNFRLPFCLPIFQVLHCLPNVWLKGGQPGWRLSLES